MRKWAQMGLALLLVIMVSGCGDSHEKVTQDMIKSMNEMADIMETVNDKASAEAAKSKLEAVGKKMEEIKKRADKLGEPTKEKKEALEKKYEAEMKKTMERFMGVMMKNMMNPDVQEALKGIKLDTLK